MNPESRICQNCNNSFTIQPDDFSFYEKMKVPAPLVCPDCRFKMRAMWRNETTLYSRTCGLCNLSIVSMYNPSLPHTVYCNECYRGDKWDPRTFAIKYDFNKPFFEQFDSLLKRVPKANLYLTLANGPIINSPYNNGVGGTKNCYFIFNSGPAEDTMYSRGVKDCINVVDSYFGVKIEDCYETINTHNSSRIFFGQNINNSTDCYFVYNCSGCINCFGCVNLRNKSYHWFNKPLTQEEYKERLNDYLGSFNSFNEAQIKFDAFKLQFPHRENNNIKTVSCEGDYLTECKDVFNSLEVVKSENCKNLFSCKEIKDSIGVFGYGFGAEFLLETCSTGHSSRVIGSYGIDQSSDIEYSFSCYPSNKYLLGCDSLKNSSYSILNMQYSKEDYEKIRNHIVKELTELGVYGLMIPSDLSPFGYNETIGNDNVPLSKEEAQALGFKWQDDTQKTTGKETLLKENISDNIKEIDPNIVNDILECTDCSRNYRIIKEELFFYKKMFLPIPRKCFYCRQRNRIGRRGPYQFWDRKCDHCGKDIKTNYSPDRKEIIYCEQCYQQEVI